VPPVHVRTSSPGGERAAIDVDKEHTHSTTRPRSSRLPLLGFAMACGVMLVALGFAASRLNSPAAGPLFWVGEVLIFGAPAALLTTRRSIARGEALGIAWFVPIATYSLTVAYSPTQFRFLDEFFTVRTTQSILATHHLFHSNPALVVSPQYPGIEIATSALVSLSHLSIFAAASLIVSFAHLLLCLGIFYLFLEVTHKRRVAALAVLVYSTGPQFQFFDSYFIYEALALPLMVGCLLATVRMFKATSWTVAVSWTLTATVCAAATVVTHHVTSYVMIGFLLALAVVQALRPSRTRRDLLGFAIILTALALVVFWDFDVATHTVTYFAPTMEGIAQALSTYFHAGGHHAASAARPPSGPLVDTTLEYLSILLLYALSALGAWKVWRSRHKARSSLASAFALATVGLLLALGLRVLGPDGSELYGRASTYFLLPSGLAIAFAITAIRYRLERRWLHRVVQLGRRLPAPNFGASVSFWRRRRTQSAVCSKTTPGGTTKSSTWRLRLPTGFIGHVAAAAGRTPVHPLKFRISPAHWTGAAVIILLGVGSVAGGWPAYYARLPGSFRAEAWERSVDQHNLDLAAWAARSLPPNYGVASVYVTGTLLTSLGHESAPSGVAPLFLTPHFAASTRRLVRRKRIDFIVVDGRMSEQLPADGSYFPNDPNAGRYRAPIPRRDLTKFNGVAGVSRIFEDGTMTVYALAGSLYRTTKASKS